MDQIKKGDRWRNKASGRIVTVVATESPRWGRVQLQHSSGRRTTKQNHYFIYDYERVSG